MGHLNPQKQSVRKWLNNEESEGKVHWELDSASLKA